MARLSISDLPWPDRRYRVDLTPEWPTDKPPFESEAFSRKEDETRARLARRTAQAIVNDANRLKATTLANRLDYDASADPPASLSSHLFMRDQRIRVVGALWKLVQEEREANIDTASLARPHARMVTIYPPKWDAMVGELKGFVPAVMLNRFYHALRRAGAERADGWLFAAVDCEFEQTTEVFRFHIHAAVSGGMVDVIDTLRTTKSYAKPLIRQVGSLAKRLARIRMERRPLDNLPYQLSYVLKSYWPERWEDEIYGAAKRQTFPSRINGSDHTRSLLWLDRHSLNDVTLLVRLRVGRSGFELN